MERTRIFPEMPDFMANLSPDESTLPFWQAASEHRLVAPRCTNCGAFRMPPSPFCWKCRTQDVEWIELSGRGTVFTFVIARKALIPQLEAAMPNVVAVVDLEDAPGCRLVGNVLQIEPEAVEIGMPVVVAWDDIDETTTIPRFVPAQSVPSR
jgi:uncharacterized OB-fold protein